MQGLGAPNAGRAGTASRRAEASNVGRAEEPDAGCAWVTDAEHPRALDARCIGAGGGHMHGPGAGCGSPGCKARGR